MLCCLSYHLTVEVSLYNIVGYSFDNIRGVGLEMMVIVDWHLI